MVEFGRTFFVFHRYPRVTGCTSVLYACFVLRVLRVPGEGVTRRRVDGGRLLCLGCGKQVPKPQYNDDGNEMGDMSRS